MIVSAQQMKQIEENALEYALSMERLMENAGSAAAAVLRRATDVEGKFITIFCGRGNNGGDGFVAARRLCEAGANVVIVLTDGQPRSEQALTMFERISVMDIPVVEYGADMAYLTERLAETDLLVDAIYGTGFHGTLDDRHRDICRLINGLDVHTVSLDMPSGVSSDSGAADENAVCADLTVVFDSLKPAAVMPRAARYLGQVVCADIGIPPEAHEGIEENYSVVDESFVFSRLQKRRRETHKGDYGRLLNIAGCQQYMGAAVLSTLAAMRSGAGYVTLASTKEVCRTALPLLMESVMLPLRQNTDGSISYDAIQPLLYAAQSSSAVLVGNGIGTGEDASRIVCDLITNCTCPVIIDADGINAVARNIDILKQATCPVALTPHLKELSRLLSLPVEQLKKDALAESLVFAKEYHVCLALKDAYTLMITPEQKIYVNTTGNAGLAKAGSGDVLAGIAGALTAQGYALPDALACAVWLHGAAGDFAAEVRSQYGMLARDVIDALGEVFAAHDR